MLKRGGERDVQRAAAWFVRWWREEGAVLCAKEPPLQSPTAAVDALVHPAVFGWGFDFQLSRDDPVPEDIRGTAKEIQWKFGRCIDDFMRAAEEEEAEGGGTSPTREKKMAREVLVKKRAAKSQAKYAAKRSKGRRD